MAAVALAISGATVCARSPGSHCDLFADPYRGAAQGSLWVLEKVYD
jgi:hypothetical protein